MTWEESQAKKLAEYEARGEPFYPITWDGVIPPPCPDCGRPLYRDYDPVLLASKCANGHVHPTPHCQTCDRPLAQNASDGSFYCEYGDDEEHRLDALEYIAQCAAELDAHNYQDEP